MEVPFKEIFLGHSHLISANRKLAQVFPSTPIIDYRKDESNNIISGMLIAFSRGQTEGAVLPDGRSAPEYDPCMTSEHMQHHSQME